MAFGGPHITKGLSQFPFIVTPEKPCFRSSESLMDVPQGSSGPQEVVSFPIQPLNAHSVHWGLSLNFLSNLRASFPLLTASLYSLTCRFFPGCKVEMDNFEPQKHESKQLMIIYFWNFHLIFSHHGWLLATETRED